MKAVFKCVVSVALLAGVVTVGANSLSTLRNGGEIQPVMQSFSIDESQTITPVATTAAKHTRRQALRNSMGGAKNYRMTVPAARIARTVPEITGCVVKSDASLTTGVYTIPTNPTLDFSLKFETAQAICGTEVNGSYYLSDLMVFGSFKMAMGYVYNLETGRSEWSSSYTGSDAAISLTFDKTDRLVYGLSSNGSDGYILAYYLFNGSDNSVTRFKRADLTGSWSSLCSAPDGTLYALDIDGGLYTMDKWSGETTLIGQTGFTSTNYGGCVITDDGTTMYRTVSNGTDGINGLVSIDLSTAASELVYQFPGNEQVVGIFISGEGTPYEPTAVDTPYINTFDTPASLDGFTIIDANADDMTWYHDQSVLGETTNGYLRLESHWENSGNDWAITPGLNLKGGESYEVSMDVWAKNFPERIEVCYGLEPTADAMTLSAVAPTEIGKNCTEQEPMRLTGILTPETDGVYYVGIHGISDPDEFYLNVDNLKISAPLSGGVPAEVSDMTVTADPNGVKSVGISFKAPMTDLNGAPLTSLTKIEILRSDSTEPVKVFDNPAPGAQLTFTDTPATPGSYTYTVYPYNASGKGEPVMATVFCGVNLPDEIMSVQIVEDAVPGVVTLSWSEVTTDIYGKPLPEGSVKYNVYGYDAAGYPTIAMVSENEGTTCTFTAYEGDNQEFVCYYVCAVTESGEGDGRRSQLIPVGKAYTNFDETFPNGECKYVWSGGVSNDYVEVGVVKRLSDDIAGVDGNEGLGVISASMRDAWGAFYSGKISLEGLAHPALTFYTFCLPSDLNLIIVEVKGGNGDFQKIYEREAVLATHGAVGWQKVIVDLSEYVGQDIQFTLAGQMKNYSVVAFDNIAVTSLPDRDMAVVGIYAPDAVDCGKPYSVRVDAVNYGAFDCADWSVRLLADGKEVESVEGINLESGSSATIQFELTMDVLATDPIVYTAEVVCVGDGNQADNLTFRSVTVNPVLSPLPYVNDLTGTASDGVIDLAWSEPDMDMAPVVVTESFEDAEAFNAMYGDWIFVDVDGSPVGGFSGVDVPNITPGETLGSFWIWSTDYISGVDAHSGSKFLFSLFRLDDGASDEWAISPLLYGNQQIVSFYAKSFNSTYPEKIEVYYSTGSTNPADFVKIDGVGGVVPGSWTLYSATLPDGARRFAIRSCATGAFMLMIDDVTYSPASVTDGVALMGYNIYRDGVKLNGVPVEESHYADANGENGKTYSYIVTTVYTSGESRASNDVTVRFINTGLEATFVSDVTVATAPGEIIITGASGQVIGVYAVDGTTVASVTAAARTAIPVVPGVYVVRVAETIAKVLVK